MINNITEPSNNTKLLILGIYAFSLILFGFLVNTPLEILEGLQRIIASPDTLITDYIGIGNMGSALVNSGSLTLIVILIFYKLKPDINGFPIACLFTVAGFAFFGKNLFNVWLIILGVFLYAKNQKRDFKEVIYTALFGTALAPVMTEILFSTTSFLFTRILLAIIVSVTIGFFLVPVSANLLKVHEGFNLYNMGFTAGVVITIVVSLLKSYGIVPEPRLIWTTGNNLLLGSYLFLLFTSMILAGIYFERKPWDKLQCIWQSSGQLVTDFVVLTGFGAVLINMGINGFIVTLYILFIGGDLNGPTLGGVFTVVGFSALGKHPRNIIPIMGGVYLGTLNAEVNANDFSMQLAALFGTTLAPIAGKYGGLWGIIAGLIHSSAIQNVGGLHRGLNLYNNGFVAGVIAAILIPIIKTINERRR
ncbi:DUF1576 domain-containing protein [Gloeocapsa sp. PCC 73106]|uniref:DUF1576 domain-containing protein n=1 Tax=Gloeocapsa sp. PCC 73106 TaxID=102232 RepID=UPI0002AC749E|nr:DUF1576 domain-containing protein [Gloeocapsa sp. PCC 73106]ELR99148.1 Protein of unknown function (DUF1576) [Gloeocapsa sp. PCC 73106]